LVSDPDIIANTEFLILPGVGSFRQGMNAIKERNLDEAIMMAVESKGSKILGICLGMQLLGSSSTENGETVGLGLIPNHVDHFNSYEMGSNKIPHVGFNSAEFSERKGLFSGLQKVSDFYFTHSYRMLVDNFKGTYATTLYGIEFMSAFEDGNIFVAQFHPEKSQSNGLILLKNFLR